MKGLHLWEVFVQVDFYTGGKAAERVGYGRKKEGEVEWKIEDSKVRTEGQMKHVLSAWTILQRTKYSGYLEGIISI